MTQVETKVKALIEDTIHNLGYQTYDVIYEKEGKDNYLRIFIDNSATITLEDCEKVNNAITDMLDEKDLIKSQYFLEISSPGLERRIRSDEHLQMFINSKIEMNLFKAIEKKKIITGILKNFDKSQITVEVEGKDISIERSNISKIKNVYDWEEI